MTINNLPNPPQIRKPRRPRLPRHVPRFAELPLAKQAHIRALLASLRKAVREARREVLTDDE